MPNRNFHVPVSVPLARARYAHKLELPLTDYSKQNTQVQVSQHEEPNCGTPLLHALHTIELADFLGVQLPKAHAEGTFLPYDSRHDNLLFDAPLFSLLLGQRTRFLRGWKQYGSCVKGFNGLGLMAEHVYSALERIEAMKESEREAHVYKFLVSRRSVDGPVFSPSELKALRHQFDQVDSLAMAVWEAYAERTIVCSTSSNMGISLHEALRDMQKKTSAFAGRCFPVLNRDEGGLVIWCPDEQADFMNAEKTATLRALEAEEPKLTRLRTYINRKQRDPGALRDALECGGYFFPTNPQSREELQNLFVLSINDMASDRGQSFEAVLQDPLVKRSLDSLGASIEGGCVLVKSAVEGGLFGLAVPYLLMLEESLVRGDTQAVSTWNQASIGAALAAAVLGDEAIRAGTKADLPAQPLLEKLLPKTARLARQKALGHSFKSAIHGVFDTANLQSLAQLFGVVNDRHMSGRGTAFVGLGSSSYANGNRCYDILRADADAAGAFAGRDGLHPATHTLNPIAQALVYGEDLWRVLSAKEISVLSFDEKVLRVCQHVHKPEPAGAASVAGYLLTRLDQETLSSVELAYGLRLSGFNTSRFLQFCGFGTDERAPGRFLQEAFEEGQWMGQLAEALLVLLDRPLAELVSDVGAERALSRAKDRLAPLDPLRLAKADPVLNLYLTGDNCAQPDALLVAQLAAACLTNQENIQNSLALGVVADTAMRGLCLADIAKKFSDGLLWCGALVTRGLEAIYRVAVKPRLIAAYEHRYAGAQQEFVTKDIHLVSIRDTEETSVENLVSEIYRGDLQTVVQLPLPATRPCETNQPDPVNELQLPLPQDWK